MCERCKNEDNKIQIIRKTVATKWHNFLIMMMQMMVVSSSSVAMSMINSSDSSHPVMLRYIPEEQRPQKQTSRKM
jgi:hypothetical protein